jgi:hypothetical protein
MKNWIMRNLLFLVFLGFVLASSAQYCGAVLTNIEITPTATSQTTPTYIDGMRAFSFSADVGCTYTFSTVGLSSVDTYLRLYSTGTGGSVIAFNDDASTNPLITQSTIIWECQTSGVYSVHLSRWRNNGNQCDPLNGSTSMSYVVECPNPLPVTLISFTTECENRIPLIKWATASEYNSDYFQIERSRDGINWTPISKIVALGNSGIGKNYQFYDMTAGGYFEGYYRLKQVDFDGNFEYFDPKYILCTSNKTNYDIEIFPNPVKEELFTGIRNSMLGDGLVTIADFSGKVVKQEKINLLEGYNLINIDVKDLLSGIYLIKITSNDVQFVGRFIKN